jgi:hypothetical protein
VVNVYGGFFGEIVTQLKMHRSNKVYKERFSLCVAPYPT